MKIQLNFNKPDNYAFFCPVPKVNLSRSNPVAYIDEITSYIRRGLKSKAILLIEDNNITGQNTANNDTSHDTNETANNTNETSNESTDNKVTEAMPSEDETVTAPVEETVEDTTEKQEVEFLEFESVQQEAPSEQPSEKPVKKGRPKKA